MNVYVIEIDKDISSLQINLNFLSFYQSMFFGVESFLRMSRMLFLAAIVRQQQQQQQ